MFVFIFLYFVSLSPFILDLLCLVDFGFLFLCLYSCILYLYHLLFQISCVLWTVRSQCVCLYSCILYLYHLLFQISCVLCNLGSQCVCLYSCILFLYHHLFQIPGVLWTVGSYVCVYILVFCIFITFYFRSLVSCGLWVPLFVFIFWYFVSLSPFILDLLCLVDCGFLCLCLYSCILYLYHHLFQIPAVLWTVGSSVCVCILVFCIQITFYLRSLVSCVLWVPLFVFVYLYFVSRSPFILDLLCLVDCEFLCLCLYSCILYLYHLLFQISCVLYCEFLCLCLYSCILYLDHLLFQISCVLWTVGSSICACILVFCIFIIFYFRSLVSCGL